MFCRAFGIGMGDGFIRGDIVKHFVKYGYYGDVGIGVDNNLKIVYFDPFYVKGIKIGDKITKINGQKATLNRFIKYIVLSKANKTVKLTFSKKTIVLKIRKKDPNYTPLKHFGIMVKRDLSVKLSPKLQNRYYIYPGAKIIDVNGKKIDSFECLLKALSTYKNVTITLAYNGIKMKIPLRK
jgi:PDZ domain-containing secreted protein